jgi:hypothetical protein
MVAAARSALTLAAIPVCLLLLNAPAGVLTEATIEIAAALTLAATLAPETLGFCSRRCADGGDC